MDTSYRQYCLIYDRSCGTAGRLQAHPHSCGTKCCTYGDNIIADLNAGINITDTLEQILISTDGRIDKFDTIAGGMMTDYVRSIQVAPGAS